VSAPVRKSRPALVANDADGLAQQAGALVDQLADPARRVANVFLLLERPLAAAAQRLEHQLAAQRAELVGAGREVRAAAHLDQGADAALVRARLDQPPLQLVRRHR